MRGACVGDFTKVYAFPEVSIESDGYLIISADKDTLQEGLHANFKLSSAGESIQISDSLGQEIDMISYPAQTTNETYGRFENGTGNFEFMLPTFNAENERKFPSTALIENYIPNINVYPYPATDFLSIIIDDELEHILSIYNITGQLLATAMITNSSSIDVSHLCTGVYFVNIDRILTKKIIIGSK